jgi:hypothetical protein
LAAARGDWGPALGGDGIVDDGCARVIRGVERRRGKKASFFSPPNVLRVPFSNLNLSSQRLSPN